MSQSAENLSVPEFCSTVACKQCLREAVLNSLFVKYEELGEDDWSVVWKRFEDKGDRCPVVVGRGWFIVVFTCGK